MERIAIKTFSPVQWFGRLDLKADALFFDKIYVHYSDVWSLNRSIDRHREYNNPEENEFLDNNFREINFLFEQGILVELKKEATDFDYETAEEKQFEKWTNSVYDKLRVMQDEREKFSKGKTINDWTEKDWEKNLEVDNAYFDIETRRSVFALKRQGFNNVYPLLAAKATFGNPLNLKIDVFNFVLKQIPTPAENTPWGQIIDFRSDEDSKLKYLSLINWINKTAATNRPINEIQDEYEYLYQQYKQHFEIHKIKTELTTWEMIVAGGLEVLAATQGFPTFFKNLFSIGKTRISLLEDEMKLPGQEIAYIHKANESFKKQ